MADSDGGRSAAPRSGSPSSARSTPRPRVGSAAVVGAGLAGLATAWGLARRGFEVMLLERAPVAGGRARGEVADGFAIDGGWPVLSSRDRRLLAWIDDVGLSDEMLPLRPLLTSQLRGGRVTTIDPRRLSGVLRIPGVRPRQALRLVRLPRLMSRYGTRIDPDFPERAVGLDDRSLGDFGRLYFGKSVLERWMAPMLSPFSLGDEEETSRVHFLMARRRLANARLGLPRTSMGELAQAAADRLKTHTNTEARLLEPAAGAVRITIGREGSVERMIEADAVVVACDAQDALRVADPMLSGAERDFFAGVRTTSSLTLVVALRRPFSLHPEQIAIPHAEGLPLEAVLLEPGVRGGRVPAGHGLAILRATGPWSDAHLETPDEAIEKEMLTAFERIHPGAGAAILLTRLTRVTRAMPRFDVGHYRAIAQFTKVQADRRAAGRRIYFAGDYLMDPSWEGALAAAERSVDAVAHDLA
jgi:protoporphyrinogen oxidase